MGIKFSLTEARSKKKTLRSLSLTRFLDFSPFFMSLLPMGHDLIIGLV